MKIKSPRMFTALLLIATASGCAHRQSPDPAAISHQREYIDLEPGWRIRIVAPILKSGTFKMQTQELRSSGASVSLKTSNDFEGYETDFYMTHRQGESGIAVQLVSAEVRDTNGKRTRKQQPTLFVFPPVIHYVRLLFLTRVSQSEHNEAILGASSVARLEQLTKDVALNPNELYYSSTDEFFSWVPEGISGQPEKKLNKSKEWVPAL